MLVTYFVNFRWLNDYLFGIELFIPFTTSAFRKLLSVYIFSYFPFGFESRMWDLIVSVPDHCLSFYFLVTRLKCETTELGHTSREPAQWPALSSKAVFRIWLLICSSVPQHFLWNNVKCSRTFDIFFVKFCYSEDFPVQYDPDFLWLGL